MSFLKSIFGRFFSNDKEQPVSSPDGSSIESRVKHPVEVNEAESPIVLTIWTIERSRVAAPRALCTEIDVFPSQAVELHEGIMGYVMDTPNGESVVFEAATGSLVGQSLDHVRDSVRELSKSELKLQLDTARREFNRMKKTELDNEAFWKAIRMGGAEADVVQDFAE